MRLVFRAPDLEGLPEHQSLILYSLYSLASINFKFRQEKVVDLTPPKIKEFRYWLININSAGKIRSYGTPNFFLFYFPKAVDKIYFTYSLV